MSGSTSILPDDNYAAFLIVATRKLLTKIFGQTLLGTPCVASLLLPMTCQHNPWCTSDPAGLKGFDVTAQSKPWRASIKT